MNNQMFIALNRSGFKRMGCYWLTLVCYNLKIMKKFYKSQQFDKRAVLAKNRVDFKEIRAGE